MKADTIKDWLAAWDSGEGCWSVEMGGLGPGYEQAIQIAAAEIMRHIIAADYPTSAWKNKDAWTEDRNAIDAWSRGSETIKSLGLSGAQWGAAVSIAARFALFGPDKAIKTAPEDRRILVSRNFPMPAQEWAGK